MAVLTEIRRRPWLLMGLIALALLAFVVNPDSLNKMFGKNPNVLGKVNGEPITRDEYSDQLFVLQQQAQQQQQPTTGLEEQAWNMLVQGKLIKQQFDKTGLKLTDDVFWSQLQFDPLFAQNKSNFDEKGNFKLADIKKQIEAAKTTQPELYNSWLRSKKSIEYRMMAKMLFANISGALTVNKKEAEEIMRQRDNVATIDFVKIDYNAYAQKNPVKVTTQDLADYIKLHPTNFKSEATRNLGITFFPAQPSAADEAAANAEMTKLYSGGTENMLNTKNDSIFVSANSDMPFNPQYFGTNELPAFIKEKVATAAVGQVFGPYKEQNFLVVSKLLDKKTSDSTLSRHILISYKGNQAGANETRSKEAAKKLADSIGAIVKANPARFAEFLKFSSDPGSAQQGGSVGWTTPATPFVAPYLNFLASNGKGATGVVESQFGYHIINIEDKKSGAMTYKVANLVKAIKPSSQTETGIYTKATKFIQQSQGKSFNDFQNLAKKNNYQFNNAKAVTRFQGRIEGLGTDVDEQILSWAFNSKRKAGDTEIFSNDGTGDRIVVYLNGIHDAGTADPEAVRAQIEPLVKNKILAKKILAQLGNPASLDAVATKFGTQKQTAQVNMLSPQVAGAMEPKVAGAAFGLGANKISKPVEGMTGVYVLVKKSETINKQPGDIKQIQQSISQQNAQMYGQGLLKSLQDNAEIKDYRLEVWDKNNAAQQ